MQVLTVKCLENDKEGLEQSLDETRAAVLRIEGALVYVNGCLEMLKTAAVEAEKDRKQKEQKEVKDAPTS